VKHRYRSAQVKAAVKVNGEKLLFNWQMGRDLVQKKAEERWGAGVVKSVGNLHHVEVHQSGMLILVLLRQVEKPILLVEGNSGEVGINSDEAEG